jgi:hypothetical protein
LPVARSGGGLQASGFRAFVAVSVNPAAAGVLVAWQRQRRASSGRRVPWSATARGPAKWSGLTARFTGLPAAAGELYVIFALAAIVIWPQYLAIFFTLFRTKELLQFYRKLAGKREAAKGGLVESYKHLREHGNSFSIVVLEIVLAIILFTAGNFEATVGGAVAATKDTYVMPYIGIILVWILPAALVWLVGTLFEREFSGA